jgi:hypothetical protein
MIGRRGAAALAGLGMLGGAMATAWLAPGCGFPSVNFENGSEAGSLTVGDADGDGGADGGDDAESLDSASTTPDATNASDAGMPGLGADGGCNFNGTWATRITIDVTWQPQGLTSVILAAGSGTITQWVKGLRVQTLTAPLELSDDSVLCGVALPDFQATALGLDEVYGVRFPDSLFDDAYIPPFTVNGALTPQTGGGFAYSTTPTAVLLGLSLPDPTTDPWPATITTELDQDQDGFPGVTIAVAQGPLAMPTTTASDYSYIPTGVPAPLMPLNLASSLYVAIRQITVASGTVQDCNTITGTVNIPTIDSKAAIDSHILGCGLVDGGQCTTGSSSEASFVDNTQPVFTPSGTTTFQTIRIATGATCADVRAAFP